MGRYALMRIVHAIPVLLILSMIVFSMILLIPGDPVKTYLGETEATPAQIHQLRHKLGLDQPLPVQYVDWLDRVLHGNLGESISSHQPVLGTLASRLPITFELAFIATLIAIIVAVPLGVIAALRRNSIWDHMLSAISVGGLAIPSFCIAVFLIVIFAVKLRWLPASGYVPFSDDPVGNLKRMVLPAVALGIGVGGVLARQIRSSLIEVLGQDYVRTARAKGISERRILWRHAIPNALIAPLTVLGIHLAHLLGGALIIETIFALPGEGSYVVSAISTRDYQVVQGGALMIGVIVVLVNIVVDILYGVIDPRITAARASQ